MSCQRNVPESHIINPLLTKPVSSRRLDTGLVRLFCASMDLNIQPSWPHTWSIWNVSKPFWLRCQSETDAWYSNLQKVKLRICQQYWLRFAGDCSSQKVLLHSEVDWNLRLYETNKGRTDSISTTSHFKKFFSVFRHSFQCSTPKTSVFHVDFLLSTISEERKSNFLRRLF